MKYLSKNLAETAKIAEQFIAKINDIQTSKAVIVGLFGDLGSGKTTFTQSIGKILGVKEIMTSPTFVIEKRYDLNSRFGFKKLIHIDAYRLELSKELLNLDFQKDLDNKDNLILIEWPERVGGVLPADLIKVELQFISESEREIEF
jgi:tRNA threonylcarbamoyladenosine biosynthesis protein TsaE